MKRIGKVLLIGGGVVAVLVGTAVSLHSPVLHRHLANLHGAAGLHGGTGIHASGPAAHIVGSSGGDPLANARARDGVAAIGRRWDEAAFAETVALYTDVHRGIEWPGILAPELVRYDPAAEQTFELYRPEQGFSEPGPVFLFLHGNGLGNGDRVAPGSDGLRYAQSTASSNVPVIPLRARLDRVPLFSRRATRRWRRHRARRESSSASRRLEQFGPAGLRDCEVSDYILMQPIVTVSSDTASATVRGVYLGMTGVAGVSEGIYEDELVRDGDVWKIKTLHVCPRLATDSDLGWAAGGDANAASDRPGIALAAARTRGFRFPRTVRGPAISHYSRSSALAGTRS